MAMDKSAADSFVYAKASGILARSYVGDRARQLFSFHTLQELWSFLFKKEVPVVPETLLVRELEQTAFEDFVNSYKKLIENYSKPEKILLTLLQNFDYENLKDIGSSVALGEKKPPVMQKITPFNIINYDKWPDVKSITAGGPLEWYSSAPKISEQYLVDYKLDCQYVVSLFDSINEIKSACKKDILNLLGEKYCIENAVWAIRLRLYYGMEKDEIIPLLAYSTKEKVSTDPLVCDTIKTLDWELDNYDKWKSWKYSKYLNPHEEGVVWIIDPRWVSNSYKGQYVRNAYKLFHKHPFTACPLVCWFIIKRNELDYIRTASETLRLSINSSQAMKIAGVQEVTNG